MSHTCCAACRRLGSFRLAALALGTQVLLQGACRTGDIVNQPLMTGHKVTMLLTSNVPGTEFQFRLQKIDAGPDEGWQVLGTGQEVKATLYQGGRYEISARAQGYAEKRVALTEPIDRYTFRFVAADRLQAQDSDVIPTGPVASIASEPDDAPPAEQPPVNTGVGRRWAVVIGVSDYQQRGKWGLTDLRYAGKDATAMAEYLRAPDGGRFDQVRVLIDNKATLANIRAALREELRSVQENDLVIVYWAGHGMPDPYDQEKLYLLGYDSDPAHMASTGYSMEEFQRDIRNLKAGRLILVADACHSAGLSDPMQATRGELQNDIVEGLRGVTIGPAPNSVLPVAGSCNLIFTSCEVGEKSLESTELGGGHGAFTYFLLEALRGDADRRDNNGNADGQVSLGEAIDYTMDKVKRFSQNRQHPDTAGRFDRSMPMGPAKPR
jgi:uncharacterized caspase-like protein